MEIKCKGGACIFKEKCKRYTELSHFKQEYFLEPPFEVDKDGNQHCDMIWSVVQDSVLEQLNTIVNGNFKL